MMSQWNFLAVNVAKVKILKRFLVLVCTGVFFASCGGGGGGSGDAIVLDSSKEITSFKIVSPAVEGVIDEEEKSIVVSVPTGTDLNGLVPEIEHTGVSIDPADGTAQDFTTTKKYTVTAEDESFQEYEVTVTYDKKITSFVIPGALSTVISEANHSITVQVPWDTDVTSLAPTISHTGISISPESGIAVNFSTKQTYTVTAADSTSQEYSVTIALKEYKVGDVGPAGGKIFYVNQNYLIDGWRYLEASSSDQSTGIRWYNGSDIETGATSTSIASGKSNTDTIMAAQGTIYTSYAAGLAKAVSQGGYSDWFLPSSEELYQMESSGILSTGLSFGAYYYWSSTELDLDEARCLVVMVLNNSKSFYLGGRDKYQTCRVRAIRSF